MKLLVVGDPHVKPEDIGECQKLADFIVRTAQETQPNYILLLGDLHHTHSLVHVEVMAFWRNTFEMWSRAGFQVLALVGNHDQPGDPSRAHALMAYSGIRVIDAPQLLDMEGNIALLPYMHDTNAFVATCQVLKADTIYCHATFVGAQYENGFYAKEGIEQDDIPQKQIISGHIHKGSEFGKVWYTGAPRWQTVTDANQDRAIWLVEHNPDGSIASRTAFQTDAVCCRIVHVEDTPESPAEIAVNPAWKYVIDVKGPAAWVEERKARWSGVGRVRTFVTDRNAAKVRESDGIGVAFKKYFEAYKPRLPVDVAVLQSLVEERLSL
jgi:DNA repair exonuclease SbcCD nuclease subunit